MKRPNGHSLPEARKNDLLTRKIPGELLVYDLKRHKAYCLNAAAAAVWSSCNGKRTVTELARSLQQDANSSVGEKIVWLALDQLEKSHLLREATVRPASLPPISRRGLIRAGLVAAITSLPLVTMISSPTAVQAATTITAAVCANRQQSDPGGCGLTLCTPPADGKCQNQGANRCRCK